jgi:co-chaperonin GroES (HSP10)
MLKIKVPGHRILIKPEAVEKVSAGGIVIARPGHGDRLELMSRPNVLA